MNTDRTFAEELDSRDPVGPFRERFFFAEGPIYMDGNSLGRLPLSTAERIASTVRAEWGEGLVGSWHAWIDLPVQVGSAVAQLIGARPEEVIVCDSTSVNLYKLAMAASGVDPTRKVILTDTANFSSDRYVLEGVAQQTGMELKMFESHPVFGPDPASISEHLDENVALVSLSHVGYKNAAIADMDAIASAVHEAGALMLWDLCHSVGALPIDLEASGADMAVGCTYKYLNGGPGSPAFLYVRAGLQDRVRQPIWGWFGQRDQFAMRPGYEPQGGIGSFLTGTPPIVSLIGAQEGIGLILEAGVEALREKSLAITEMMIGLHDEWLRPFGVELASPRDAERRGSHLALQHPDAYRICLALIEKLGVVPDFREPDVIRYGIAPIYTTFCEAWDAMDRIRTCLDEDLHAGYPSEKGRVT